MERTDFLKVNRLRELLAREENKIYRKHLNLILRYYNLPQENVLPPKEEARHQEQAENKTQQTNKKEAIKQKYNYDNIHGLWKGRFFWVRLHTFSAVKRYHFKLLKEEIRKGYLSEILSILIYILLILIFVSPITTILYWPCRLVFEAITDILNKRVKGVKLTFIEKVKEVLILSVDYFIIPLTKFILIALFLLFSLLLLIVAILNQGEKKHE